MKFLKESWKFIVGVFAFLLGLIWFMNSNSNKKVKKLKKNIKSNEKKTKEVDKKIETIKKEKVVTKKKISKTNQQIKNVKKKKPVVKKKTANNAATSVKNRLKKK
jgi:septal ring factor EnvC (AmiA/AmiB activator)